MKAITPDLKLVERYDDWGRSSRFPWIDGSWLDERFVIPSTVHRIALEISKERAKESVKVWLQAGTYCVWWRDTRTGGGELQHDIFDRWLAMNLPQLKDNKPHKFYIRVLYD